MNYLYQQPFPWAKALQDGLTYLRDVEWKYSAGAAGFGALVGLAGAWSVWRRARCAPDVLAGAGVARTFQNSRLFHQMTVLDNVLVGMDTKLRTRFWHAAFRLPRHRRELRESSRKALEILRFAGLEKEATAVASSLSYGHQRRLEIARALAVEPVILLLDEPAAGMNPTEAAGLMELIRRIRGRGIAVLLIEHHMKVVMGVSDEIAVLEYGNKIAEGKPEAIKIDPKVRAAYLGTAEV
ncbi:MAG: ABC transporter ATP-binding protein [Candidatus Hydrogenedentes bacterium]|nr:ABC transporter ATP-binding protein [Candidatus Hydrogenedentota bacterium]